MWLPFVWNIQFFENCAVCCCEFFTLVLGGKWQWRRLRWIEGKIDSYSFVGFRDKRRTKKKNYAVHGGLDQNKKIFKASEALLKKKGVERWEMALQPSLPVLW